VAPGNGNKALLQVSFYFWVPTSPFRVTAAQCKKNLPRKAELAWQVRRYLWKGLWNFKIFFLDHFSPSFLSQNWQFQDSRFSPLIERVLAGVSVVN
jgi:hypothetical protein